ncbi:hypothetical protein ACRCPE_04520 [Pseudomonas aeruginosa]
MKSKFYLVLGLLVLAGCSDDKSKLRGEFLSGCVQGGSPKPICICIYERLEKTYSTDQLKQIQTGRGPLVSSFLQDSVAHAKACIAEQ